MPLAKEYQPKSITAREVYGRDITEADAPEGYEFTGEFIPPTGEVIVLGIDLLPRLPYKRDIEPRYILRKKQDLADQFEIAPGPQPRTAVAEDWVWTCFNQMSRVIGEEYSHTKLLIFRKIQ
jgi:hypothetical protein